MRKIVKVVLCLVFISSFGWIQGCEEPTSAIIKGAQQAQVEHERIEAEKDIREQEIQLERDKLNLEREKLRMQNNNRSATGGTVDTGTAEDTKTPSINEDTDDKLTNTGTKK